MRCLIVGPRQAGKSTVARNYCREGASWLNLSPAAPQFGPIGCADFMRGQERHDGIRFIGSMHLHRAPLQAIDAVIWAQRRSEALDLVLEMPLNSLSSISVYVLRYLLRVFDPDHVISIGLESPESILQTRPNCKVETRAPDRDAEQRSSKSIAAYRRAAIRSYLGHGQVHDISLRNVRLLGSRIGSGIALEVAELEEMKSMGFKDADYAEVDGRTLYVVTAGEPHSSVVTSCADRFGCKSAHLVHPKMFEGLLIGFENAHGEHVGVGRIVSIDFHSEYLRIESPIEPPSINATLHFGIWRTDALGHELGELRPWQV
ncbi:MAG: hypothetical protein KIT74_12205 [Fimbriimonadales bacterium]|nr:hypothetical protein [Fimbriimonadales bacterium]